MFAALSGWFAGLLHVLSGPDHLAAVAPLSISHRPGRWRVGVRWGLGHAGGVLIVGLASLALREVLPVEKISSWAEQLVGVVLVLIGLWGFRKAMTTRLHAHEHVHDGERHLHFHVHDPETAHDPEEVTEHHHTHAALAVGILHGLAGSSHFLGVLPALAFPTRAQAISYLVAFGLGTIMAMGLFSLAMNHLGRGLAVKQGVTAYRWLTFACSTAAVVVGCVWMVRTGLA